MPLSSQYPIPRPRVASVSSHAPKPIFQLHPASAGNLHHFLKLASRPRPDSEETGVDAEVPIDISPNDLATGKDRRIKRAVQYSASFETLARWESQTSNVHSAGRSLTGIPFSRERVQRGTTNSLCGPAKGLYKVSGVSPSPQPVVRLGPE